MRKYGWLIVAAVIVAVVLLLKRKPGGGIDAPGNVEPGDVTFSHYKEQWDKAKARSRPVFHCIGLTRRIDKLGPWRYSYEWNTADGSYIGRQRVAVP